jgi:transposase
MQGKLARPVWGWGPGETPGPTPLFVGSSGGGRVAASMYTLVSSAARNHLDVWAYVNDVLRQLANGSEDYESLLPDRWRQSHPDATRPYRDAEQQKRKLTTQQRRVRRRLPNSTGD